MSDIITLSNPYSITTNNTAVSFKVECLEYCLFKYATFRVTLYDENSIPCECKILTLSGYEFIDWQGSDNYVINWVRTKLNLR